MPEMESFTIHLEEALSALGEVLEARGTPFELVIVGGGALSLLGLISRPTKDLDVVAVIVDDRYTSAEPLPHLLSRARDDVAAALGIPRDWLNAGPTSLLDFGLPSGFNDRLITRRYGGLIVHLTGRVDQIFLKFYAAVDRGPRSKHVADLRRLSPTAEELRLAARWARSHDPSEGFLAMSRQALAYFGIEDDDVDR